MDLSNEQLAAADAVRAWLDGRLPVAGTVFRLFGYAGTGKTTIARELSRTAGRVKFASFTGKAASVLQSKGCHNATTIHKLIYVPQDKSGHRLRHLQQELAREESGQARVRELQRIKKSIDMERANLKRPHFALNPDGPLSEDVDLLVIDEVSMVGRKMAEDLMSFEVPILVLGDPAQLPPVGDTGFFINAKPNFTLTEIHRQAADNPIISLATRIRQGRPFGVDDSEGAVRIVKKGTLTIDDIVDFDQVIVGTNRRRVGINAQVRERLGHPANEVVPGDKLICLRNNHELGLLNGSQWQVLSVRENVWGRLELDIEDIDGGRKIMDVDAFPHYFEGRGDEIPHFDMREADHFDFGYAITCHKAQGSEWPRVCVIDEGHVFRGDEKKWRYTAVTRASESLTVVKP